ncbi:MAG: NAD-dependent epimerase/dehydratase family protein [Myxococcota bacterium]
MRVALTGASGLLGGNLAIALCERGDTVVATRRGTSRVKHLDDYPIEWVDADLGEPEKLTGAFTGAELVFHVAAMVSVRRRPTPALVAANVEGTRNVVTAVRAAGVRRLVHTSTVGAVGLSEDGVPCTEGARWNFGEHDLDDGYVTTKHQSELLVAEAVRGGLDAVVVNPTYMLGPFDSKPSSGKLLIELARGKIPGLTPGANNFVDVRDVVRGMLLAAERGRAGERYILGGENMPYAVAFARMAKVIGVAPPTRVLPGWIARGFGLAGDVQEKLTGSEPMLNSVTVRYGYCKSFQFSSAKAEQELGYTHGPIEPAIADAIAWFRASGML